MTGYFPLVVAAAAAAAPPVAEDGIWKVDTFLDRSFIRPDTLVGALLYGLLFLVAAYFVCAFIRKFVHRLINSKRHLLMDPTLVQFFGELAQLAVYGFAMLLYAHLIPALHHLGTALLASVSVASLVIGFAAQQALGNLIAGLSLLFYRPFRLGDRLQVSIPGGIEVGLVERLDLGYTLLRTDDNRQIVIPNSVIAGQVTLNLSQRSRTSGCTVAVRISPKNDLARAREILHQAGQKLVPTQEAASVDCQVTAVTGAAVEMTLSVPFGATENFSVRRSELWSEIKRSFDAEGIQFA